MRFDLVLKNGTVVDGLGNPRRVTDVGISDGRISALEEIDVSEAAEVLDVTGLVVAPGVIDVHTHYDAQLHWDPCCTASGTHGVTSVVIGNCGFGFAPCKPELRDRYMQMMERTEQIPYQAMVDGMQWEWETFPEWIEHLRRMPKGVNVGSFLPMNALLIHVLGIDAAKSRAASASEREEMKRLLHEAMDAGALGFSFTWLGDTNNHTDFDGTPMPTDVMEIQEAYVLAEVLRERDAGMIQTTTDIPLMRERREVCANLARISGRPVLHNVTMLIPGHEYHTGVLSWLDECMDEGLPVYSQGILHRPWTEFDVESYSSWDALSVFRDFSTADSNEKTRLAGSREFRDRVVAECDFGPDAFGGIRFPDFMLVESGCEEFAGYERRTVTEIAESVNRSVTDTFFDILVASGLRAVFTHLDRYVTDSAKVGPVLRHPRVLAGGSDGGAHVRYVCNGQWSTDLLTWLTRDGNEFTLEEMHQQLSKAPADLMGFSDRGALAVGLAADIMVYDYEQLGFSYGKYEVRHDFPAGEWRRFSPVTGMKYVLVNGEITMVDAEPTGVTSGSLLAPDSHATRLLV